MDEKDLHSIQNAMLWAAYGDALGFITELVNSKEVQKRTGANKATKTVPWAYLAGGQYGAEVQLPAGSYSDDTQLRLSVCRAIRGDGVFDVEAFAKVELPIWLSYALGAGKGTKAAAQALARTDVNWFSNFFKKDASDYYEGGGNGAAMRIQPHVLIARDPSSLKSFLPDVIKNAVCTHGHPRGILGAVFHALCLAHTLAKGTIPDSTEWIKFTKYFSEAASLIKEDSTLGSIWLPVWEKHTNKNIKSAFEEVAIECVEDIEKISSLRLNAYKSLPEIYLAAVEKIGATESKQRGSGTKTAILAALAASLFRPRSQEEHIDSALITISNALFSDTDTIASMAGAILGVVSKAPPTEQVSDRAYIEQESLRLYRLKLGNITESFSYPDLLKWKAPATQADAVGAEEDRIIVAGIGRAEFAGEQYIGKGKSAGTWQWLKLDFGQTILIKRRDKLKKLPEGNLPRPIKLPTRKIEKTQINNIREPKQMELSNFFQRMGTPNQERSEYKTSKTLLENEVHTSSVRRTLDELTKEAINSGFNQSVLGEHLHELSAHPNGIELAIGYISIIMKAIMARKHTKHFK